MTPTERLAHLADVLEYDADDASGMNFHLSSWIAPSDSQVETAISMKGFGHVQDLDDRGRNCGTTGCAVGLACLLPEFREEGLSAVYNSYLDGLVPTFSKFAGFDAVTMFFGISARDAQDLFHSDSYRIWKGAEAERAVAKKIRRLLSEQQEATT